MGYCSSSDIKADFKKIVIDANASITPTALGQWIEQESAYIDSHLALRYVLPITLVDFPEAALVLKRIAIFLVSERVRSVLDVKTGNAGTDSDEKAQYSYIRKPNADLDKIAKGLLVLKGVPQLSTAGGVGSFNSDMCGDHVFDVRKQQW